MSDCLYIQQEKPMKNYIPHRKKGKLYGLDIISKTFLIHYATPSFGPKYVGSVYTPGSINTEKTIQ